MSVVYSLEGKRSMQYRFGDVYGFSGDYPKSYQLLIDIKKGKEYYHQPLRNVDNQQWYATWQTQEGKIIACHPKTKRLYTSNKQ